jgi:hypothetical protein
VISEDFAHHHSFDHPFLLEGEDLLIRIPVVAQYGFGVLTELGTETLGSGPFALVEMNGKAGNLHLPNPRIWGTQAH